MPNLLLGKSRTCPLLADTSKLSPRYFWMVLALAGDSTMTRFFCLRRVPVAFAGAGASSGALAAGSGVLATRVDLALGLAVLPSAGGVRRVDAAFFSVFFRA